MNAPVCRPRPVPRGLGMFLASPDVAGRAINVDRVAANVAACGAKWAAVFVEGPSGGRAPMTRLDAFPSALEHYGIAPWCWTFPHPERWEDAIIHLRHVMRRARWAGCIVDRETAPDGTRWKGQDIAACNDAAADMRPLVTLWDERYVIDADGPVLLQVYRTAANDVPLERRVARVESEGHTVVPLVGTYLGDENRLRGDLERAGVRPDGSMRPALGIWSAATTNAREREVLRQFSERMASSP